MSTKFKPGTVALTKTQRAYIAGAEFMRGKIAADLREEARFSCGCDPKHCTCEREREVYRMAADMVEEDDTLVAPPYEAPLFSYRKGPAAYELQIGRLWFRFCYLTGGGWGRWIGAHFFERFTFGWERDK